MKPLTYDKFKKTDLYKPFNPNGKYTPLDSGKAYRIYRIAMRVRSLEGCTAEVGVYGGVTTRMIEKILNRKHYAYDTYQGIMGSDITKGDKVPDGGFSCSLENVKNFIGENDNIEYVVGMFPDTFTQENEKFVLVHSDTDTYMGTKTSLEKFWPLIVSGGFMIIDDWGNNRCGGVTRACKEFMECENGIKLRHIDGQQVFLEKE